MNFNMTKKIIEKITKKIKKITKNNKDFYSSYKYCFFFCTYAHPITIPLIHEAIYESIRKLCSKKKETPSRTFLNCYGYKT